MSIFLNKRLLVLGGAAQHLHAVQVAKDMGIHVIVTDIKKWTEAKAIADESLDISVMDSDALIEWCKNNPVDGVLNFNIDFAQRSHQKICEEFGFPGYGNKEQYDNFTDKQHFKKLCKKNGVDVIPEYKEEEIEKIEYPVLVKPAESSGSRGAHICYNQAQLKKSIIEAKNDSRNGRVIIEKYMIGCPDIEAAYYVNNGTPHLMWVGDRYLGSKEDGLHRQCVCFVSPTRYLNAYIENTHPKVCKMIQNAGLVNAPVFFQGFVDGDTVRFYDPGIRFPGDEFSSIMKKATGIDLARVVITYALTGKSIISDEEINGFYKLNNQYGALYQLQSKAGVIGRFDGMDKVNSQPLVVNAVQKHYVGDCISDTGDLNRRIGEIALLGADTDTLIDSIEEIKKCIKVEDEQGNDLLVSSFDCERIR